MTTPFDRRILWVHWEGDAVTERTIGEMADAIKANTPNVAGVVLKTSNGAVWQGSMDRKSAFAVNGPTSIQQWVSELNQRGLETHLWCVVRGNDIPAEADIVAQACNVAGVKSMLLDVEGGADYFGGKAAADARNLITRIRAAIRNDFHIGLNFDARGSHPANIHIDEWIPHVQSLHPMVYHWEFGSGKNGPENYLDDAFGTLYRYALPVVPMLQTYPTPTPMPENEVFKAGDYAFTKGAVGISLFRYGGESSAPQVIAGVKRIDPKKVQPEANPAVRVFRVVAQSLRVRASPSTSAATQTMLPAGTRLDVRPNMRKEIEGYVWWETNLGWVAQERIDRKQVLMIEVTPNVPPFGFVTLVPEEPEIPGESDGPDIPQKRFRVIASSVNVRKNPDLTPTSLLNVRLSQGTEVIANADDWTEAAGYLWWNHGPGWSAERSLDGKQKFFEDLTPNVPRVEPVPDPEQPAPAPTPTPIAQKTFRITTDSIKIRVQPGLSSNANTGEVLRKGDQITVAANAWREIDGYVWWQHSRGWSAERSLKDSTRFMEDLTPNVPRGDNGVQQPAPTPTPAPTPAPVPTPIEKPMPLPNFKRMHVVGLGVRVRSEPSGKAPQVGTLPQGSEFLVDTTQTDVRVEQDGYIWWKHSTGWSAEKSIDGKDVFMLDVFELPLIGKLFERLPVRIEDTQWVQYYGNTSFAYANGKRNSYDKFAQGLHSGLDFGHSGGAPIFAGVNGVFLGKGSKYGPNRVDVKVGDYRIIYGHIGKPATLALRAPVTPDSVMGIVEVTQVHLHLEVRYKELYIVNPLLLMPQELVNQFVGKFPPKATTFVKTGSWTRFQSMFEQPIIRLGGEVIGPTAV